MENLPNYEKEERPWGNFERFTLNEKSTVKILTIKAGEAFSLQTHEGRKEFWHIISGNGKITVGTNISEAQAGQEFLVPPRTLHRAEGGSESLVILEISLGEFDESDVTRIEDKYGRH
ncbi:phosphomannose isomerase type II C-terminal cupin domain [Acetobacteraceae bacterium]|nr:phosphomannose isomerase type II C-terminal cupin domain [Candidatus Parcubacteria bacterium]